MYGAEKRKPDSRIILESAKIDSKNKSVHDKNLYRFCHAT